jgi:Peroxidase, family 2
MLFVAFLSVFAFAFEPAAVGVLDVGVYNKPSHTDQRSPCPAFNTLANHGYLPRDGITLAANELVAELFQNIYGFDPEAIRVMLKNAHERFNVGDGSTINLVQLRLHNGIEHDVSMFRDDLNALDANGEPQLDNYSINESLVKEFMQTSKDGVVMVNIVTNLRRTRILYVSDVTDIKSVRKLIRN